MKNTSEFDINQRRWDEMASIHSKSRFYDVKGFKEGKTSLYGLEQRELGDVSEKSILHLMCHFGLDSMSLARKGAHVTGVDFSQGMVDMATKTNKELGLSAKFMQGNVYDVPRLIEEQFDIVYMTYGLLCWLPDLPKLFEVIASRLKPGGFLYMAEFHPYGMLMDVEDDKSYRVGGPYFVKDEPELIDNDRTYVDTEEKIQNTKSYEWQHTLMELLNGIFKSGLHMKYFNEHPFSSFQFHPDMELHEDKHWYFKHPEKFNMPFLFSLKAFKSE